MTERKCDGTSGVEELRYFEASATLFTYEQCELVNKKCPCGMQNIKRGDQIPPGAGICTTRAFPFF